MSKKVIIWIMIVSFLVMGKPLLSMAGTKEITTIYQLTSPFGTGRYETALGIDRLLNNNHPWLRKSTLESQGFVYNLKVLIDNIQNERKTTLFYTDPFLQGMARNRKTPFKDGLKGLDTKVIMMGIMPVWVLLSEDPGIKNLSDLVGKRVALGPKAGVANVVTEEILKTAGVLSKIKAQHLSFGRISGALLDRQSDAGMIGGYWNPASNLVSPMPPFLDLESSGRTFHIVEYGEANLKKTAKRMNVPNMVQTMKANTLPFQPKDAMPWALPSYLGADSSFPEDLAYEYVKSYVSNLEKVHGLSYLGKMMTPEFMTYQVSPEDLHPGALRAYRELGLLK